MKPAKLLPFLLLLTILPAHAIVIEDSSDRFSFDFGWAPYTMFGFGLTYPGRDTPGQGGSYVRPGQASGNPFRYLVEVNRFINGVRQPVSAFQVLFTGDWERPDGTPDPVWGTTTAPRFSLPADHLLPIPGNDHAVRVVLGNLPTPVPDSGGTLLLLVFALSGLLAVSFRPTTP